MGTQKLQSRWFSGYIVTPKNLKKIGFRNKLPKAIEFEKMILPSQFASLVGDVEMHAEAQAQVNLEQN